jgi:acetyltransferase-like isoleucine patch superfamily enzyme
MDRWWTILRYDWPLHFVLLLTNWLPDNVIFLRLRGFLTGLFLGKAGEDLRLARNISFYNPSKVEVGAHVYLAYGCVFISGEQPIVLGDEVLLGPYCVLASNNHTHYKGSFRYGKSESATTVVGSGSWLGSQVVVTAGSKIGSDTLVAAGAVVAGAFPDHVLLGGVPARIIKRWVK